MQIYQFGLNSFICFVYAQTKLDIILLLSACHFSHLKINFVNSVDDKMVKTQSTGNYIFRVFFLFVVLLVISINLKQTASMFENKFMNYENRFKKNY